MAQVSEEKLTSLRERLQHVLDANQDLLKDLVISLKSEHPLDSVEELKKQFEEFQNEDKTINVGIVGRVKAGKSSLLNSLLFDGITVLPKAATPMTAALTIITYGEEYSAVVEFFTKEDIHGLRESYELYEKKFNEIYNKRLEELRSEKKRKIDVLTKPFEKVKDLHKKSRTDELKNVDEERFKELSRNFAKRKMQEYAELQAAYEQYETIKNASVDISQLEKLKKIKASSLEELGRMLSDYVGTGGKYMPFVKSVELTVPLETLRGLKVVDTPGLNDPVISREEKTRQFLKNCDVVFILSPAGQFLSREDQKLLDRVTFSEGIRKVYILASQLDTQLFGSIKYETGGDLQAGVELIARQLSEHAVNALSSLKDSVILTQDTLDELIDSAKEGILYSSSICWSIIQRWNDRNSWDDGMKKVWENLTLHYPDYFSDDDKDKTIRNLELLANIPRIREMIDVVRREKAEIIRRRREDFVNVKIRVIKDFNQHLISKVNEEIEIIKNATLEKLNVLTDLSTFYENKRAEIQFEYEGFIEKQISSMKDELLNTLEKQYQGTGEKINESEERKYEFVQVKKRGFIYAIARFFGSEAGYEKKKVEKTVVMAGTVYTILKDFASSVEREVKQAAEELRIKLRDKMKDFLEKQLLDIHEKKYLEQSLIFKSIETVVNTIDYPKLRHSSYVDTNIKKYGILEDKEAIEYLNEVKVFLSDLKQKISEDIESYLENLREKLTTLKIADMIFSNYNSYLDELKSSIENKKRQLERYQKILKELESMSLL
ncbi:dynamin family protein [Fervidobacterium islandicum]|uniref:Dynamin family protein n=1 Tax=Fervidobacterium islandicum TaxID=2423 RepID=A0AAI8CMA3_FERIS|nr:dynamin family protein [Fervidobacterium islandicum]AMW33560.1 dynamin family protein [Fervidobacterium islandicum]